LLVLNLRFKSINALKKYILNFQKHFISDLLEIKKSIYLRSQFFLICYLLRLSYHIGIISQHAFPEVLQQDPALVYIYNARDLVHNTVILIMFMNKLPIPF